MTLTCSIVHQRAAKRAHLALTERCADTKFTRLSDGRLLLTYAHRVCQWINDDSWGMGLRGAISYTDGSTWDLENDLIIITAQDDFYPR